MNLIHQTRVHSDFSVRVPRKKVDRGGGNEYQVGISDVDVRYLHPEMTSRYTSILTLQTSVLLVPQVVDNESIPSEGGGYLFTETVAGKVFVSVSKSETYRSPLCRGVRTRPSVHRSVTLWDVAGPTPPGPRRAAGVGFD